jgi:hypothetical protein
MENLLDLLTVLMKGFLSWCASRAVRTWESTELKRGERASRPCLQGARNEICAERGCLGPRSLAGLIVGFVGLVSFLPLQSAIAAEKDIGVPSSRRAYDYGNEVACTTFHAVLAFKTYCRCEETIRFKRPVPAALPFAQISSATTVRRFVATNTGKVSAACRTNSFTPETRVLMADGTTKAIEDISVGDRVVAFDPETGERGVRAVTDTIVGEGVKQLVGIRIRTLSGESTIWATEHHPFWNPASRAWVDAGDLRVGSVLLTEDGDRVIVTGIDEVVRGQRVHNLTVEGIHTYYVIVADETVLVHNCLEGSDLDLLIKRGGMTTTDFEEVASHLDQHSKISRGVLSDRLHKIKSGVENNRNVVFTKNGGVYDATSGDYLGSLTVG